MEQAATRNTVPDYTVAASGVIRREQNHHARSSPHFCYDHHVLPSGLFIHRIEARQLGRVFRFVGITVIVKVIQAALIGWQSSNLQIGHLDTDSFRERFSGCPVKDRLDAWFDLCQPVNTDASSGAGAASYRALSVQRTQSLPGKTEQADPGDHWRSDWSACMRHRPLCGQP